MNDVGLFKPENQIRCDFIIHHSIFDILHLKNIGRSCGTVIHERRRMQLLEKQHNGNILICAFLLIFFTRCQLSDFRLQISNFFTYNSRLRLAGTKLSSPDNAPGLALTKYCAFCPGLRRSSLPWATHLAYLRQAARFYYMH